jgi:hypothetical protein
MQKGMVKRCLGILSVAAVIIFGGTQAVKAETLESPNYKVIDTQFGSGTTVHGCSDQYCARVSIGNIEGTAPAPPSTAEFSEEEGKDPFIEVIIEAGESNLGVLTTEQTATNTALIKIRNHLSDGYALQVLGDPPKFDGHVLKTPSVPTASVPGTEQFAINLAKNTTPDFGKAPTQVPSTQPMLATVDERYGMPDLFMYKSGDVIAQNGHDSGRTDYTISMIVNIANSTPAGKYAGDFSVLVVPAY